MHRHTGVSIVCPGLIYVINIFYKTYYIYTCHISTPIVTARSLIRICNSFSWYSTIVAGMAHVNLSVIGHSFANYHISLLQKASKESKLPSRMKDIPIQECITHRPHKAVYCKTSDMPLNQYKLLRPVSTCHLTYIITAGQNQRRKVSISTHAIFYVSQHFLVDLPKPFRKLLFLHI